MRSVLLYGGLIECEDIKHALFSYMVTTTYISDDDKIKLLKDTINYIDNNMRIKLTQQDSTATIRYFTGAEFRQFTSAIGGVKQMLRFPFDETKVLRLASEALKSWNFALQVETLDGRKLIKRVNLLRQIIDLFQRHHDDVWKKDEEDGEYTPCKIYNIPPREYFIEHEHVTTTPHEPKAPEPAEEPVDAEAMASLQLNALLLQLKDLCT